MNLSAYFIQLIVIGVLVLMSISPDYNISIFKSTDEIDTPVNMSNYYVYTAWIIVLTF